VVFLFAVEMALYLDTITTAVIAEPDVPTFDAIIFLLCFFYFGFIDAIISFQ
jgi:hypothetical protein